ncbi:MAG TPA: tetratricopeptide repeat protein, partial [Myxococcales bacterium]|nr:tetratricopeptide repeat protein [Myxococcales bacterium]
MIALLLAAATMAQPGRDPSLLHRDVTAVAKDAEREAALRRMLELGGSPGEQAEALARLAAALRAKGLHLALDGKSEADRSAAADARAEAIARYRELLRKYPDAPRTDEALFFLADTLQDSGRDGEAVAAARELTKRFPQSKWAPASHVFIGEHLFDEAKLDAALAEYRAAAEVPGDEVYPYALYKAAWCRFNQGAFGDAMKLLQQVSEVSEKSGSVNTVQLAKEARRDFVLAYARVGAPAAAREEFAKRFGDKPGLKMLEQYGKLLFDTGRDVEAQLVTRQLLAIHGDQPAAALDQTRLLVLAQRSGRRRDLLGAAQALVAVFQRVKADNSNEAYEEASRLGEETLRNLAVQIHNEARKTELDETWAAARALYADYLALFPDAADAVDLRFFYGELLYTRDAKAEAADQYEQVVRHGPGKWLQKAAWSAVLSRYEVLPQQAADKGERRAQRELNGDEQKLAQACLLYLQSLPAGPHAVEVAFKLGRLEYLSGQLDAAQKHLAFIALEHPEHELAEYAANLVLDIENLKRDWDGLHRWAVKFLGDKRLTAHGRLLKDLTRIEEESAYAMADAQQPDGRKSDGLLKFVAAHPHGQLADKALFGAAAALSRQGRLDDALAVRARLWKEQAASELVPRALLASASDLAAIADVSEAAGLLEQYVHGFQKQEALKKWRREHPAQGRKPLPALYEAEKAQTALHDAAVLREADGELSRAVADRALALRLFTREADKEAEALAIARLRARMGEPARAARELAQLAKTARAPSLQLTAWREAADLYTKARETANAAWSWTEAERIYQSLGPRGREKLSPDAVAAAAAAHFALGAREFDQFRQQSIKPPLMATLNRKIALLQAVRRRAEETVAMGQAGPAVCDLSRLGEAQMLLAQAIAQSPAPPSLDAEQRKLYRAALQEKAQPILDDARATLRSAGRKAQELGVTGACTAKAEALLEKLQVRQEQPAQLALAPAAVDEVPEMAGPEAVQGERAKRMLGEALVAPSLERFAAAAQSGSPGAQLDYAIALDRAGQAKDAEGLYRQVATGAKGAIAYGAAARAAALAVSRGDAEAARAMVDQAAKIDAQPALVLKAEIALALGD